MTLSLELMTDTLPVGFAELQADAKTDGHGHLTRLAAEFAQSLAIFGGFTCIANLDGARLRAPLRTPYCKKQRRTFPLLRYMQEMKARPGFGRQLDSAQLPVAPGLAKQQRLVQLLASEVHK
jgi:hypothetical protein